MKAAEFNAVVLKHSIMKIFSSFNNNSTKHETAKRT